MAAPLTSFNQRPSRSGSLRFDNVMIGWILSRLASASRRDNAPGSRCTSRRAIFRPGRCLFKSVRNAFASVQWGRPSRTNTSRSGYCSGSEPRPVAGRTTTHNASATDDNITRATVNSRLLFLIPHSQPQCLMLVQGFPCVILVSPAPSIGLCGAAHGTRCRAKNDRCRVGHGSRPRADRTFQRSWRPLQPDCR